MQSEILLAKVLKLFIFFQTYLPNIPIHIDESTLKLTAEKIRFPRHFLFCFLAVFSPHVFLAVFFVVVFRIILFLPRSSPEYPSTLEVIFFCFYFCVVNIVISATHLILQNRKTLCDTVNGALKLLVAFRTQVTAGKLPMSTSTLQQWNQSSDNSHKLDVIQIAIKIAPLVIFIGFLGTNTFLIREDLDPAYLFLKYFPFFEQMIQFVLGLEPDTSIKDHWLLYPGRLSLTFMGWLLFWGFTSVVSLGIGSLIFVVIDLMNYLIEIADGNGVVVTSNLLSNFNAHQPVHISSPQLYLMHVIVRRYKEIQIYVRSLNNIFREHAGTWLMCGNILSIILAYASIRYMRTMDFLYTVYMPMLSLLLNLAAYILLGIIVDLADLPERLIRECEKRARIRKNVMVLNSLYRFRLKLDHVNIRRSFIPAYFKHCLDNVATLLLSTL